MGITAGGDFIGLCDQKSSYKHVSNFERLWCYGHFLIPVHALVWTTSYGTSWRLMYSAWCLIVCFASIIFAIWLVQFTAKRQPVLWPAVAFSKTSFKYRSIQIKGNFTKLTLHLYFKCIMYYAGLLFVPFIVSNRYLLFWVSNGHNSVTIQNWTHVYMNFFHHKDLGNHLQQLCPKVMKHPV